MSASLITVIEHGGFDLNTEDDARWLLGTQAEYERLIEKAQELVDEIEEAEYAAAELEFERRWS